jgi:hypothetical protein
VGALMNRAAQARRCVGVLALTLPLASHTAAQPDVVSAPALKAAFLYNFAKFAEWPPDALAAGDKLVLCVIGDDEVARALDLSVNGRSIEGHDVTVRKIALDGARACHLAYVAALDPKRALQFIASVKGAAIFSVSDGERFAESGGVAQLFTENSRMRFAINVASAQRARLQISSRLLTLARVVKDDLHGQD